MNTFTERVLSLVKSIPSGQVMTYGQISKLCGSPRGARQVVRILHSMSEKYGLPWHRVVNASGKIAIKDDEGAFKQMVYLREEGIEVDDAGSLDLERYRYHPTLFDNDFDNEYID